MIQITDLEQKFLRLALDSAAEDGEIRNASVMFFKSLRARGVKADTVQPAKPQGPQVVWQQFWSNGTGTTTFRTW